MTVAVSARMALHPAVMLFCYGIAQMSKESKLPGLGKQGSSSLIVGMYGHAGAVQIQLAFSDPDINLYSYIHDPTSFPMGLVMLYIFEKPVPNSFLTMRQRKKSPTMPLQFRRSYLLHEHISSRKANRRTGTQASLP